MKPFDDFVERKSYARSFKVEFEKNWKYSNSVTYRVYRRIRLDLTRLQMKTITQKNTFLKYCSREFVLYSPNAMIESDASKLVEESFEPGSDLKIVLSTNHEGEESSVV